MRPRQRRPGVIARRSMVRAGPAPVPEGCVLVLCDCPEQWVIGEGTVGRAFCWTCGERFELAPKRSTDVA